MAIPPYEVTITEDFEVKFKIGVQSFKVVYDADTLADAQWFAAMLNNALANLANVDAETQKVVIDRMTNGH